MASDRGGRLRDVIVWGTPIVVAVDLLISVQKVSRVVVQYIIRIPYVEYKERVCADDQ